MKALTLTQPWATLVAIGAKRIETRSLRTDYRGPLAIHAAKGFPRIDVFAWYTLGDCVKGELAAFDIRSFAQIEQLPRGVVVAVCNLLAVHEILQNHTGDEWNIMTLDGRKHTWRLTTEERAFGDYSGGRYAWLLADVQKLAVPVAARGALGLWDCAAPELAQEA